MSDAAGHEIGEDSVQIYREAVTPEGSIYVSKHGANEFPGDLDGKPLLAAYPPLEVRF